MKSTEQQTGLEPANAGDGLWVEAVRQQVGSLSFGVVQIVVHEGRVVQIERTEKVRFTNPVAASSGNR
jgi:hypothetical protein